MIARVVDADPDPLAFHFTRDSAERLAVSRMTIATDGDAYTPATLELSSGDGLVLQGWPLSRMAILRPSSRGIYLRVTFGVARFRWGDATGYGFYEHACPLAAAAGNEPPREPGR